MSRRVGPLFTFFSCITVTCLAWSLAAGEAQGETQRLLLLGQAPDGHPAATHEYRAGVSVLAACLAGEPDLEVSIHSADEPWSEGPALIDAADGVVLFLSAGAGWTQQTGERHAALQRLAARGGGITALHWAMGTRSAEPIEGFLRLLGGCHGGPDRKYTVTETLLEPTAGHPITRGIEPLRVRDEFYYRLKFFGNYGETTGRDNVGDLQPIVRVTIDEASEVVAWAWQRPEVGGNDDDSDDDDNIDNGGGRSFGFSGLHFHANWQLPEYRRLITQGVLWTMRREIPADGVEVDIAAETLTLGE